MDRLAAVLDDRFRIPGTDWRFGLDPLIGLVPGIGDTVTLGVGLYLLALAREAGAPFWLLVRMFINIAIDWLAGSVPLIGDLFDLAFKAHRRNATLLRRYLEQQGYRQGGANGARR